MREKRGNDHISVGMRKPNGEYERPIPGSRLFWTKPGNSIRRQRKDLLESNGDRLGIKRVE